MTANVLRAKIQAEIERLDEHELEDLYRVIHNYQLNAQTEAMQDNAQQATESQKILKQVLERMQAHLLINGTPCLNREQLHERS